MVTEKERKKKMQAVVYGPPPRPDENSMLEKPNLINLQPDKSSKPNLPDESQFRNVVYGPPPRREPPSSPIDDNELMKRLKKLEKKPE